MKRVKTARRSFLKTAVASGPARWTAKAAELELRDARERDQHHPELSGAHRAEPLALQLDVFFRSSSMTI